MSTGAMAPVYVCILTPILQLLSLYLVWVIYSVIAGRSISLTSHVVRDSGNRTSQYATIFNGQLRFHETSGQPIVIIIIIIAGIAGAAGLGFVELIMGGEVYLFTMNNYWLAPFFLFCDILMPIAGVILGAMFAASIIIPLMALGIVGVFIGFIVLLIMGAYQAIMK